MHYLRFLDSTVDRTLALSGVYHPILVIVSVLMAAVAAYAALGLAGRIKAAENRGTRQLWLATGATAMGIGIWAMHFIGMLAFQLPIGVAYNLGITLLSVGPAIVASSMVLYVTSRAEIGFSRLGLAGTMMGLGIGAMHYTGMAAMRMAAEMYYDRLLFGVSLIVAVVLATAALYIHFLAGKGGEQQSSRRRFAAAFTMGSAVAGMHYTAMAAAYFFPSGGQRLSGAALDPTVLAILVGLAAAVIMAFAIFVVVIDTRLKAAAHSVRTSRDHMMHAMESVSEGFSLYDAQDRLMLCNNEYRKLVHLQDKDLIGETFENIVRRRVERGLILLGDNSAQEWITRRLAQHRNPSGPHIQEYGGGRWLQVSERKTEDGGTVAIYTDVTASKEAEQKLRAAHDNLDRRVQERTGDLEDANAALQAEIDERKQAQQELINSQRRLSAVLETAGEGIITIDSTSTIVMVNQEVQSIWGYQQQELVGNRLHILMPEKYRSPHSAGMKRYLENGVAHVLGKRLELEGKKKDGTNFPLGIRIKETKVGERLFFTAAVRDITERKRVEQALRESEGRFRELCNSLPQLVWTCQPDGPCNFLSEQWIDYTGVPAEEQLGYGWLEQLHPDDREPTVAAWQAAVDSGSDFFVEFRIRRHDGEYRPFDTRAVRLRDTQGHTVRWVGSNTDITERKQAEERQKKLEAELQQAQKLESLGVLAGGIAHDFNNLLMGVLGNAEIAVLELPPESPARGELKNITTAALRAAELTKQMLAYSGKGKFVVETLNLSKLVREMAHLLQVSISKNVVLKYNFADSLPAIEADASQIRQIVMNLILNASEAVGETSGVVTVSTGMIEADRSYLAETYLDENLPEGHYVSLEVADTGCGMDEQTQQKIFDPFFTTKFTGRGLGLAAVLGIVRGHGGALKIYSELRQGTTFKILFPASRQPTKESIGDSATEQGWRGSGGILVVDDEETVRIATKRMLETLGFTVLTAEDGREALEVFRSRVDEILVVLLDLTMPHLGGEETYRELRRIRPDTRVILSSGYNEQEITSRFAGKGLAGFIQKPYGVRQLREKIRHVLEAAPS